MKQVFKLLLLLLVGLTLMGRRASAQGPLLKPGDAVVTCEAFNPGDPPFGIMHIQNANTAPLNVNWMPPMTHPATWTRANYGEVFGIAIDPTGDIYLTTTSSFSTHVYTGAGSGAVFKISGATGLLVPGWPVVLPNDPVVQPGLGNVYYDPDHGFIFVTNMEDGKIYQINATTGVIGLTYDPFAPDGGSPGFAPRGERLWGIGYLKTPTDNGKLYFGRWQEDMTHPSSTLSNEIYSVALTPTGNFVAGPPTLLITLPPLPTQNFSNPVSDIEFSSSGLMLVGERSMSSDNAVGAHEGRMLEYKLTGGLWGLTTHNFDIGAIAVFGTAKTNSAGGVDYGYRGYDSLKGQTQNCDSMAWSTGDALHFGPDYIYGMQGLPETGGSILNSVLIDFDGITTTLAKYQIGDVDIYKNCSVTLPNPCLQKQLQLQADPNTPAGGCCWILNLTNTYSATFWSQIQLNVITGATFGSASGPTGWTVGLTPLNVNFTPPGYMPLGGSTFRFCLVPTAALQKIQVVWIGKDGTRCYDTLTMDCPTPPHLCATLTNLSVACGPIVNGQRTYTTRFNIWNTTNLPFTISSASVVVTSPAGVSFSPPAFGFTTVNPGGTSIPLNGVLYGGHAGDKVCLAITVCNARRDTCCKFDTCFTLPKCPECCDSLHISFGPIKQSYASDGSVTLAGLVTSNPTLLRSFNATIVSATQSTYCPGSAWAGRIPVAAYFTAGTFTTTPALSMSPLGTGTLTWGSNPTGVTVVNAPLSLKIKFPALPGARCRDTIVYCVKYTYTDVACRTCDTTVCYTIVRYGNSIIVINPDGGGVIVLPNGFPVSPADGGDRDGGKTKDGSDGGVLSANDAKPVRITMNSNTNGTLTIDNPALQPGDDPNSNITITGVLIEPEVGVDLTAFTDNTTGQSGQIIDRVASITGMQQPIGSGQSRSFALIYNNPLNITVFRNYVQIQYTVGSNQNDVYEVTMIINARTPAGTGGDVLAVDNGISLTNVRTYGLKFDNGNSTGDKIARVVVTLGSGDDDAIMAVGPGIDKTRAGMKAFRGHDAQLSPLLLSEEPDAAAADALPLNPLAHVTPIYVTVCGGTDQDVTLNYSTYNEAGDVVSTGTITANAPLSARSSGISDNAVTGIGTLSCIPNPVTNQATLQYTLPKAETMVWITVTNGLGREVLQLLNGTPVSDGSHELTFDVSKLASGTYYCTIRTSAFTQTRSIQIVH